MKIAGTNRNELRALVPDVTTLHERQVFSRPHNVRKSGKLSVTPYKAETKDPPRNKPICYNCGKYGHIRKDCKSKPLERNHPTPKNM